MFDWDFPDEVETRAAEEIRRHVPTHREMWSSIWAAARRLSACASERSEAVRLLGEDKEADLLAACRRAARRLAEAEERIVRPVPLLLVCPGPSLTTRGAVCGERHIDRGTFAAKPHHTHTCQLCGHTWRPALVHTVGVEFLPGTRDSEP